MSTITPKNNVSVGRILVKDLVFIDPSFKRKDKLVEMMVRKLCAAKALGDPNGFMQKVEEREKSINTTLDTGLAIPHSRVDGVNEIVGALALLHQGIPDPVQPDLAIRAVLLFFVPNRQEWYASHLQLLRKVAMLFEPAFIDRLLNVKTGPEVIDLIRKKESA